MAKTADAGSNQLLKDPERAKQDYIFAQVDLALGLIDGGLAIKEGGQLLKGLKAADKLAVRSNPQAIFNLPSDNVVAIQRAVDLERAGDPAAAETIAALRKKHGANFDAVYDNLKII